MLQTAGVGTVMAIAEAIEYNKLRYYSWKAINLIQKMIGTPQNGIWDTTSIIAVINWQKSVMRLRPITADGMFGPTSLGLLIEEMVLNGQSAQAEILRQFSHRSKGGGPIVKKEVVDSTKPVYAFFQFPVSKLDLRPHPTNLANWIMKGSFKVELFIDQQIEEPSRYEYRQFIKGRVWVHDGYFGDAAKTIWQPRSGTKEEPVNNAMAIPGGLNPHFFTEDGEVMPDMKVEKFGYRSQSPTNRFGIKDEYSNYQTGSEYWLQDTFGIEGPRKTDSAGFKTGLKVGVELYFRGIVIKDGKMPTQGQINGNYLQHCVAGKEWFYKEEKIVTW